MRINYTPSMQSSAPAEDIVKLPYFSLKSDGAFAYVRFMEGSLEDLDIQRVHPIEFTSQAGKKLFPFVSCIRTNLADVNDDSCPFCNASMTTKNVIYVKMIEYTSNGPVACVWQKPWGFINELKTLINDYGDITKCIFKVTRNGAPGDTQTKYVMSYMPNQSADIVNYPIVNNAFADFDSSKACIWTKTYDEMQNYVTNGSFFVPRANNATTAPSIDRFQQAVQESQNQGYMIAEQIEEELPFGSVTHVTPDTVVAPTSNVAPAPAPRRAPGNFPWQTNNGAPTRN